MGRGALIVGFVLLAFAVASTASLPAVLGAPSGSAGVGVERVSIVAPPVAPADHPITLYGSVIGAQPGELVEIESKDCGQSFFRGVSGTRTQRGGQWSAEFFPGITTRVRAVWRGHASRAVLVRQRAMLRFMQTPSGRHEFVVSVVASAQFWRRKVTILRYERRAREWRFFRTVLLTTQNAPGQIVWTTGRFTARVPSGTLLQAILPASQAGPCYLPAASLPLRT